MTPAVKRVLYVELNEDGTTGGSHQSLLNLVTHLDRRRFAPVVICYQQSAFVDKYRAAGAEVHVWKRERAAERAVRGPWWMPYRLVTQSVAIIRRVRFIRRERIDLVHVNNSPSFSYADWLPACRVAGIRCMSHLRGELTDFAAPARLLVPRFDRLVAISGYIESRLRDFGVPAERITRVYNGMDARAVMGRLQRAPELVRAELGVAAGELLVVIVGHLRAWKGQGVVLRAAAEAAERYGVRLHVALVGAGDRWSADYEAELRRLADVPALAGRVHLLGARKDAPDLMRAADVVVHASTEPEPFGLVLLEAMILGRPLVASRLGGPAEILTPDSGWTFDPSRPGELAALLRDIAADPAAAAAKAARGRERARDFTMEATLAGVERVYDELLGASRPRPQARAVAPVTADAARVQGARP